MNGLTFFDCNTQLGRYGVKHPEAFTTAEELASEMAYSGIAEALAYHSMSKEYAPTVGNEMLLQEIRGEPIHACWVVMPHHTGEMPPPDDLLVEMKEKEVRALRAFPVRHQFRLADWCSGGLLDMVETNRIPFFLDLDQTNWDEIEGILKDHP
ncbi:MAG: hypothetical protein GTN93_21610, partial [Anaerolineae bacterium]|nr:hypothetical protein [Anaerolineae bacterium]